MGLAMGVVLLSPVAIDGTGTSDSYEVTRLPGWLPHRTDRQVRSKTPHQKGTG